jgi:hypothetical protein
MLHFSKCPSTNVKAGRSYMDENGYEWNSKQKQLAASLRGRNTFHEGIRLCLEMHAQVHDLKREPQRKTIYQHLIDGLDEGLVRFRPERQFSSIAWNLWHISRIEDAVTNMLIAATDQVFNKKWQNTIGVGMTDTGNAMQWNDVERFDAMINVQALYQYRKAVGERTQEILPQIRAEERLKKPDTERLSRLLDEGVLINDPESLWLLDYWKNKTIVDLLLMPITRHQIVHIHDSFKIKRKYGKNFGHEA